MMSLVLYKLVPFFVILCFVSLTSEAIKLYVGMRDKGKGKKLN